MTTSAIPSLARIRWFILMKGGRLRCLSPVDLIHAIPGSPRKSRSAVSVGLTGLARIARWNTGDFVNRPCVRPRSISIRTSVWASASDTQNRAGNATRKALMASLEPDLVAHDVPPHAPVAEKAEPGIREGRGPVLLEEEMPGPGERVALHQACCDQPPELCRDSGDQRHCGQARADEVQSAAGSIGMLAEIERIELRQRAVAL